MHFFTFLESFPESMNMYGNQVGCHSGDAVTGTVGPGGLVTQTRQL